MAVTRNDKGEDGGEANTQPTKVTLSQTYLKKAMGRKGPPEKKSSGAGDVAINEGGGKSPPWDTEIGARICEKKSLRRGG